MGVVNNVFIYPFALEINQYGEIQFILQTAAFFTPFLLLGFGSVLIKYFPKFKDNKSERQKFYGFVFTVVSLNVIVLGILFFLLKDEIVYRFSGNGVSKLALIALYLIAALLPYNFLLKTIAANHGRIAIPAVLHNSIKVVLPALALALYFEVFDFSGLIWALIIYYALINLIYVVYVKQRDTLKVSFKLNEFKQHPEFQPMLVFALFSVLSGIGASLTNQIDIVMVTSMKGTYSNGLYSWSLFVANAIYIPYSIVSAISSPLIAGFWERGERHELQKIYKQSSITLLAISLGMFLSLWLVIDDLFDLMAKGDQFRLGKYVVLLLCSAKIIDLATGLNSSIIAMSEKYRMLLYFLLVAVALNIGLNFWLIPEMGIEGCAIATTVSIIVYNLLKWVFLLRAYNMQPFTQSTIKVIALALILFTAVYFIPKTSITLLNLGLYSGLFAMLYFGILYRMNLIPEVNNFVDKQLARLGIKR